MSYKTLSYQARAVLEEYKNKRSWCWKLPHSHKTAYLLELMDQLDNDNTSRYASDLKKETILLVGLTAFKNYLEDEKNEKLSIKVQCVMDEASQEAFDAIDDSMLDTIDQAKKCIRDYGAVQSVGGFRDMESHLRQSVSEQDSQWPTAVMNHMDASTPAVVLRV